MFGRAKAIQHKVWCKLMNCGSDEFNRLDKIGAGSGADG